MKRSPRVGRGFGHRLAAALVAVALLIAAPGGYAAAQIRIGINGGRPSELPILREYLAGSGLTQDGWLAFASEVGANWLPGTTPVPLDYPAQFGLISGGAGLTVDQSVEVGRKNLHAAILAALTEDEPAVVAGLSMGTLVIDRELAYLATADDAPDANAITFYVFGDPARGFGEMYMSGVTIPFVGQTFRPVPESQYNVVVVMEQWDGWANPPDRPWNLLAVVNAVMGAVYTVNGSNDHSMTAVGSMSDAVEVSRTTNSLGGTTTTYMIPRKDLPITRPLLQIGVPVQIVDEINKLLMPLIATGYSSMTPYLEPRIDHGQLVFTPPPARPVQPAPPGEPLSVPTQGDEAWDDDGSTLRAPDADSTVTADRDSATSTLEVVAPKKEPSPVPAAEATDEVESRDLDGAADTVDATPSSEVSPDVTDEVDTPRKAVHATKVRDVPKSLDNTVTKVAAAGVERGIEEKRAAPSEHDAQNAKPASDSDGE